LQSNTVLSEMNSKGLEISTIDKYQGRDKSVIIISCVISKDESASGALFDDVKRLNVAISRAKKKIIFFGSFKALHKTSTAFRPILDSMARREQVVSLPDDALEIFQAR